MVYYTYKNIYKYMFARSHCGRSVTGRSTKGEFRMQPERADISTIPYFNVSTWFHFEAIDCPNCAIQREYVCASSTNCVRWKLVLGWWICHRSVANVVWMERRTVFSGTVSHVTGSKFPCKRLFRFKLLLSQQLKRSADKKERKKKNFQPLTVEKWKEEVEVACYFM